MTWQILRQAKMPIFSCKRSAVLIRCCRWGRKWFTSHKNPFIFLVGASL